MRDVGDYEIRIFKHKFVAVINCKSRWHGFNTIRQNGMVKVIGIFFSRLIGKHDVTLSAEYLEGLKDGNYTLTVTFVVAPYYTKVSAPASFTVSSPAPAGSDSPATVESIALVVLSNILTKSSSCSSRLPARSTPSAAGEWQSNGIFYDS